MSGSGRRSDASVQARRETILDRVLSTGRAEIRELADQFEVSVMTMHRDLDALVADGLVAKQRGWAEAPPAVLVQTSARFRLRTGQDMKRALADAAARHLTDAGTVLLDDSTSCLGLIDGLGGTRPVTVVTNYLRAARDAGARPGVRVHLLPGEYRPDLDAVFGLGTVDGFRSWRADVAAFSVPAVTGGQMFHPLPDSLALKEAMTGAAARRVLLIDHTKFGHTAAHVFAPLTESDVVIVDDATPAAEIRALRGFTRHVEVVPVPRPG
ncbi:MAG: DeoR/GlpR family DNA-binding transcription regulator [Actinocatenispora sp.]